MSFTETFASTAEAVLRLGPDAAALATLPDDALLAAHTVLTEHRRATEIYTAWLSAEIARRSPRDAGYAGLAQRQGFGSATALIEALSPVSHAEATALVEAGQLMTGAETLWESALSDALNSGALSIAAVEAIRRGLAPVADRAPAADLLAECEHLIGRVPSVTLDELRREGRTARDRLDAAGIARREQQRRDHRYLKRWVRDDGMYQGSFLLDPESGQLVFSALDAIAAPRRGVRFVDAAVQAEAQAVIDDPRTNDQLLADALVDMIRLAVDADPGTLFGNLRPAVRVIVTETALSLPVGSNDSVSSTDPASQTDRASHGFLEGDPQPISRETVDRHICNTGIIGVKFDRKHQVIDLGRTQRLFTEVQRLALSVRDGGCVFPDCARPPSHCEAHHIDEWERDHGLTNVRDGVLLCRHHHMLLHNNHWQIIRDDATYWLKPPRSADPAQVPRQLHTKSPAMAELARRRV
ncbi:MAG: HNH endonuclease [Salinibacterium sp.]|nr:HNH endonuclease [Salinibacterium sp.]